MRISKIIEELQEAQKTFPDDTDLVYATKGNGKEHRIRDIKVSNGAIYPRILIIYE